MRQFALAALTACVALPSFAAERWETLPPTPAPIATDRSGEAEANGIKIHYAIYGQGSPVIFLHGGLANTGYWGNQVPAVAAHHTVILMDSRGHGRSTRDARPYGYDLMADDAHAVLMTPTPSLPVWSKALRKIQPSPPISTVPAMNMPSIRRRPRNTTRSSIRSARCGRTSRTGPTISSRRSIPPLSLSTATTTRRSSGRTPNISRRPFRTQGS
jgi:alpha/beta hydrolase fold